MGDGADPSLAHDNLIPPVGLIQDSWALRRARVGHAIAALVINGQAQHSELLAGVFTSEPPHVRVLHPQRLLTRGPSCLVDPKPRDPV